MASKAEELVPFVLIIRGERHFCGLGSNSLLSLFFLLPYDLIVYKVVQTCSRSFTTCTPISEDFEIFSFGCDGRRGVGVGAGVSSTSFRVDFESEVPPVKKTK